MGLFAALLNEELVRENSTMRNYKIAVAGTGLAAVSSSFFAALCSAFGRYDVVHIHAEGPAFFCWIPKLFGKRVISTIHGECEIIWATREKPDFMRVCAA